MNVLIFGGTTEGRLLAQTVVGRYKDRHSVTVSVATSVGAHELAGIPGIRILVGRLDAEEMIRFFRTDRCDGTYDAGEDMQALYDLIVDATHPYAVEVSANIRRAAAETGVRCVRLLRTESEEERVAAPAADRNAPAVGEPAADKEGNKVIYVDSAASAAAYLAGTRGRILLTTGAKELLAFADIPAERLIVRVLPTAESVAACEQAKIPYRNTIAMMGPFSREMNAATMRQYQISWMVTKESGKAGGYDEKMAACRDTGVRAVVIVRPCESGLSMEQVLALIERDGSS